MDKIARKTGIIVIIFYLLAFSFFFIYSIVNFSGLTIVETPVTVQDSGEFNKTLSVLRSNPESEIQILYSFKLNWILTNSLRLFVQNILSVHSTALIFAFSLFFPWRTGRQNMKVHFVNIIEKSIFMFLVLTLLFTILAEGLLPGILKKQANQQYMSGMAVDYFTQANKEINSTGRDRDYSSIILMLKAYLQIDPGNPTVNSTLDWAVGNVEIKKIIDPPVLNNDSSQNKAADYFNKANEYLEDEDYYSALYYADLAYKLDKTRKDAQRVAAKSREGIRSLEPNQNDKAAREYYGLKKTGFDKLQNDDPIGAYYIFRSLSKQSTEDGDIIEFLKRSTDEITAIAFFTDEAEKYMYLPGFEDIIFLENNQSLIHIGKMILLDSEEAYFYDIEVVEINSNGIITKHFKAPFGKYLSSSKSIIMQVIDRDDERINFKPEYITGTADVPEDILLLVSPDLNEMASMENIKKSLKYMNIIQLFKSASIFDKYGYLKEPVELILLSRILKPFTFLILSFLSVSIGWFLRYRSSSLPWMALLIMPVIPVVMKYIISVSEYCINLLFGYALMRTSFTISIIILIASQGLLLFIAMISIAGQKE
ncbi:MAG: hypothetical protein L3J12_03890 [Spirochaetales bacterium]|nr:hypothetical protein [Spirochaetales bacterium]